MTDLKELRWRAGRISQGELAELAGVSRVTISNIETGRHKISIEVAKKLAAALGVEWTIFFE